MVALHSREIEVTEVAETGIVVVGSGEVRHRPSALLVRIGVSVTRASVRQATDDAANRARAVMRALSDAGIADDDIQTANIAVGPRHDHLPGGTPKLVGYTFTNTLAVLVRDLEAAGRVLDAALSAGGDDAVLDSVMFSSADADGEEEREIASRARAAAFADARAKAEQLAGLAGVTLGSPVSIDETGYAPRDLDARAPRMMAMSAEVAPPIAAGQMTTVVRLRVCFAIV
jgi:uncharacterized protein YggE